MDSLIIQPPPIPANPTEQNLMEHVCSYCNATNFKKLTDLRKHLETQHGPEKPFQCTIANCPKKFSKHINRYMHEYLTKHECPTCKIGYKNLKHHIKFCKPDDNKKTQTLIKCGKCNSSFNTNFALKIHNRREHNND